MKRSKICGLLLASFIMFGLSLNVCSDSSALKYAYSSLLLTPYVDYYEDTTHDATSYPWYPYTSAFNFYNSATSSVDGSGGIFPYVRYGVWYSADSVGTDKRPNFHAPLVDNFSDYSTCTVDGHLQNDWNSGSAVGYVGLPYSPNLSAWTDSAVDFVTSVSPTTGLRCRQFGQDSWIEYSSLYMHSTHNLRNWYLQFSELSGYSAGRFYGMILPLTYNPENIGPITQGKQLTFETEFEFQSPITLNTNEQRAYLYVRGLSQNNTINFRRVDCGMVYRTVEAINAYHLITTCNFDSAVDYKAADFVIAWVPNGVPSPNSMSNILNDSVSADGIFDFTGDFTIWQYLITDGDDTMCSGDNCHISYDPFGWGLDNAPGNPSDSDYVAWGTDDIAGFLDNFWENIFNLFTFNLFNPFSGFFGAFVDGGSCVSIPILTGMIHSNETQVCPWFNSTVRNIGTPVFAIASSMLLFGFIVRWFKSTSNDFSPTSFGGAK